MSNGQKIIVVDDDPDILEQLNFVLKSEGYEVVTTGSQAEAEEALMVHRPDLAIVDLILEEKDSGFVLCHEIKRLYPETPIILLTSAKSSTGIAFQTTSAEQQSWVKADRVMDKPVRPEQLKNEIHRLLSQRESMSQA